MTAYIGGFTHGIGVGTVPLDLFTFGLEDSGDVDGTIAQTLPGLAQAATGITDVVGSTAQTLPGLAQSASGALSPAGLIAQTLPGLSQSVYAGTTESLTIRGFQTASDAGISSESHRRELAYVANLAIAGKTNNIGEVTLAANVLATTVIDSRVSAQSVIVLSPITRNAAVDWAAGTTWIWQRLDGSFTILHAESTQTDRKYGFAILG